MVERDWRVSQAKMAAQIHTFQLTPCQNPTRDMGKGVTGLGDKERQKQSYWELESLQTNGKGVGKTKPLNPKPEGEKPGHQHATHPRLHRMHRRRGPLSLETRHSGGKENK